MDNFKIAWRREAFTPHRLLVLLAAMLAFIGTTSAIPLNCSAASATLNLTNTLYTLVADCNNNIILQANNITLDCSGYRVIGTNASNSGGISIIGNNNSIIKNCNITNFAYGVAASSATNTTILNTTAVAYYYAPTCASLPTESQCNAITGCTPYTAPGVCSGTPSGSNPCWGAIDKECDKIEGCEWVAENEFHCGYCGVRSDVCPDYTDERSCDEAREGCQWQRDCNVCVAAGGGAPCESYSDQTNCEAASCTWTPGAFSCSGDSSCQANFACFAFYSSQSKNLILNQTYSPSGGGGLWAILTDRLSLNTCIYNNSGRAVYTQSISNSTFENATLTGASLMAALMVDPTNNTINNSRINGGSYALFLTRPQRTIIQNTNSTSAGYSFYDSVGNHTQYLNIGGIGASGGMFIDSGKNITINGGWFNSTSAGAWAVGVSGTINSAFSNIQSFAGNAITMVLSTSSNNTITNLTARTTLSSTGLFLQQGSNDNNISNSDIRVGITDSIAYRVSTSHRNRLTDTFLSTNATSGVGAYFLTAQNNTIDSCTINNTGNNPAGVAMSAAFGNNITNNIISSNGTVINSFGFIPDNPQRNLYRNNTLIRTSNGTLASLAYSGNNTFCLNNFTEANLYVEDYNGTNNYNCTFDGKNQGNIWANVMNDSVHITGQNNSSIAGLYIGTGTNVPYNNSTSLGKFKCPFAGCGDYAPLTLNIYVISCGAWITWALDMPENGTTIWLPFNSTTGNSTFMANTTTNQTVSDCIANVTSYLFMNGSLFAQTTDFNITALIKNISAQYYLNGLEQTEIMVNSTAFLANGSAISTETRTYILEEIDMLNISVILSLGLLAGLFFYQHRNAQNKTWGQIWLLFGLLMACIDLLAIHRYAEADGLTWLMNMVIVLFAILFWTWCMLFLIAIWGGALDFLRMAYAKATGRQPKW